CLPAGLTGVDGPKGLAADCELDVDLLALAQKGAGVRFLGMRTETDWRTKGTRVVVRSNVPFEAARAPEFVTITPDVPHGFAFHGDGLAISGDFRPGVRYEIALKKGFPAGALGALDHDVVRSVWCGDREASLDFPYGGGVFAPGGLQKLPVESVSVKEITVEAARMYASNLVAWALSGPDWRRRRLMRDLGQKTIAVRGAGNAKSETLVDLREVAKGLDPEHAVEPARTGVYFVSARAGDSWHSAETVAVVTDLGLTLHAAQDSAVCWVTSLATAEPVAGVAVKAYSSASQEIASAVTDAQGVARLALPRLPEGESPAVVTAEKDGDLSYLLFHDRMGGRVRDRETVSGREVSTAYSVFSTPERGAYRPGETVRLSALARNAESNRVAADLWLELQVTNANGRKLFSGKAKTDAAGRVALDVPIPDAAPSGLYRCQWSLPGEKETLGEATFRVADFIPPTLKMTVSAADGALPAAQPLAVTAKVNHLFGAPAANLPVQCLCEFRAAPFVP
ncbi:MAG: hypothetical protein J6333_09840, partial [Planctomycetes bacterium]|nr:hypothetical protein [Planctomycetota bacterium]